MCSLVLTTVYLKLLHRLFKKAMFGIQQSYDNMLFASHILIFQCNIIISKYLCEMLVSYSSY